MNYRDAGLSDKEYETIKDMLGREPNELETALIGVMWSEHCSYKSTRPLLATFPQQGARVVQGPGENAGVVDCGGGWGLAFKVESHNHPSAVAPYQGAATGVGGIVRDILAMGAKPAASMDGLFLGSPGAAKSDALADGIVAGIAGYGNAVGVPTVGGKTFYDPCFDGNPLVNAFSCGFVREGSLVNARAAKPGDLAVLLGSKTGRDGIAGASFASRELDDESAASRPQIQIGDPFEEKLLIDCCLAVHEQGLIASMQDMGAAGILSSSSEIAHKSGVGMEIYCEKIPLREEMEPWEIFLSESQERMLLIVNPDKFDDVYRVAEHFSLECVTIGQVTDGDRYKVYRHGGILADLPLSILGDAPIIEWPSATPKDLESRRTAPRAKSSDPAGDLLKLLGSPEGRERRDIWRQYDCQIQLRTAEWPGEPVSAIRVPATDSLVIFAMEGEPWKCWTDPYSGAAETMALSLRKLHVSGAEPLGMTNCLNFPSPENPENFHDLSECVRGLAAVCADADCPVVSGNVSLYNETPSGGIYPTPVVVTAGLVHHEAYYLRAGKAREGDAVYLAGSGAGTLGASRWQILCSEENRAKPQGATCGYNPETEGAFRERAAEAARRGVASSARVIAGGGLAVAAAREAIATGIGMDLLRTESDLTETLFGEGGPRALYFVPEENRDKFTAIWEGYPLMAIGRVGGSSLAIRDVLNIAVADLERVWRGGNN